MRMRQPDGNLAKQLDGLGDGERSFAAKPIFQRAVLHILHHEVGRIGRPADVKHLYDVTIRG